VRESRVFTDVWYRVQQRIVLSLLRRLSAKHREDGFPQIAVFAHDVIGQQVAIFGRYEHEILQSIETEILPLIDPAESCAVDVGANVGNHTFAFAEHFAEVHAFEPNPNVFRILVANVAEFDSVCCHNVAVSDASRSLFLDVPMENICGGSVSPRATDDAAVAIEAVTLDAMRPQFGRRVGLMKIDVEGHELEVFRGSVGVLREDRPIVLFEQAALEPRIFALLESLGYRRFAFFAHQYRTGLRRIFTGRSLVLVSVGSWEQLPPGWNALVVGFPS
jgi:FkbM family methyltransferase